MTDPRRRHASRPDRPRRPRERPPVAPSVDPSVAPTDSAAATDPLDEIVRAAIRAAEAEVEPGVLYLVPTPIGNRGDVTLRALGVLRAVTRIAAEDTRTTGHLLTHFGLFKPLVSYHEYNESARSGELVGRLLAGESVAVVTDAGTPGISDPAYAVVRAALEAGLRVVALPGATALIPALVSSGLPTDRFAFEGFLPTKKGRKTRLDRLATEARTILLYESPHRLLRTLTDLEAALGDRPAAVARELTKRFEEVARGTLSQLRTAFETRAGRIKGEIVLAVAGLDADPVAVASDLEDEAEASD